MPFTDPAVPLVFLHAFPLNGTMWQSQMKAPSRRPRLAPNLPGFGDRPPGDPSLDHFADEVVRAMDAAGIQSAVVVGLSMGGYVALRLYARHPDRVAAMVLADTRAGADDEAGRRKRTEQAARVREEGVGWLPEALLPGLLGETTRTSRPAVVEGVRRLLGSAAPEGVARALEAMRDRPDSRPLLASIEVPVLAVVGEEDTITPPDEARAIAEAVPDGRLVILPGAGHLSSLETPEAFSRLLGLEGDG